MSFEYGIVSSGTFVFDPPALVEAARRRWPDAEVSLPAGDIGDIVEALVYLPTADARRTEVALHRAGDGISVSGHDDAGAAEVVEWVARTAPVPSDGSVVLIHWLDDFVQLTPATTAEELLAMNR